MPRVNNKKGTATSKRYRGRKHINPKTSKPEKLVATFDFDQKVANGFHKRPAKYYSVESERITNLLDIEDIKKPYSKQVITQPVSDLISRQIDLAKIHPLNLSVYSKKSKTKSS